MRPNRVAYILVATLLLIGNSFADDYVKTSAICTISHAGYDGAIALDGHVSPTGVISEFVCNDKSIGLASDEMKDGLVSTKDFGQIRVQFATGLVPSGPGLHMHKDATQKDRVVEVDVPASRADAFAGFVGP